MNSTAPQPGHKLDERGMVWDPLGESPELMHIHNPGAKLDHAKKEIAAARFHEIPVNAVEKATSEVKS